MDIKQGTKNSKAGDDNYYFMIGLENTDFDAASLVLSGVFVRAFRARRGGVSLRVLL